MTELALTLKSSLSQYRDSIRERMRIVAAHEPVASLLRLRLQRPVTMVLGPQYKPNSRRIEIDITYHCDAGCFHCDRSCGRAPTGERMTPEQVERFVEESVAQDRKWEQIGVLGGEPTMHPHLMDILNILLDYKRRHSPQTLLVLKTNGKRSGIDEILKQVPPEFDIRNSGKESAIQPYFSTFNIAPVDTEAYRRVDFTNCCFITANFGLGLTPYGYYACSAMGGGIDRVFGFDLGRKSLPLANDGMADLARKFCPLCGHFRRLEGMMQLTGASFTDMSPTWKRAYSAFKRIPPQLTRY